MAANGPLVVSAATGSGRGSTGAGENDGTSPAIATTTSTPSRVRRLWLHVRCAHLKFPQSNKTKCFVVLERTRQPLELGGGGRGGGGGAATSGGAGDSPDVGSFDVLEHVTLEEVEIARTGMAVFVHGHNPGTWWGDAIGSSPLWRSCVERCVILTPRLLLFFNPLFVFVLVLSPSVSWPEVANQSPTLEFAVVMPVDTPLDIHSQASVGLRFSVFYGSDESLLPPLPEDYVGQCWCTVGTVMSGYEGELIKTMDGAGGEAFGTMEVSVVDITVPATSVISKRFMLTSLDRDHDAWGRILVREELAESSVLFSVTRRLLPRFRAARLDDLDRCVGVG